MKTYVGMKIIKAEPMNLGDYNDFRKWIIPQNEDPKREGYHVIYEDGYHSWSPKDMFEKSYHEFLPDSRAINATVFPSMERTVFSADDPKYGGGHRYQFKESLGFANGHADYVDSRQEIHFVKKEENGELTHGLQSEQLVIALLDRHIKLDAQYHSIQSVKMLEGLRMFLEACKERVQDRTNRGVMGDLKK